MEFTFLKWQNFSTIEHFWTEKGKIAQLRTKLKSKMIFQIKKEDASLKIIELNWFITFFIFLFYFRFLYLFLYLVIDKLFSIMF